MKRLAMLGLIAVLAGCGTASAYPPSRWERLPESAFQSFVSSLVPVRSSDGPSPRTSREPAATPTPVSRTVPPYLGIRGIGTYYAYHRGQAAAAQALRDFLGVGWRGETVTVWHGPAHITVVLTDYESSLIPGRLIDLDSRDWHTLCGDLSRGVCEVIVTHG